MVSPFRMSTSQSTEARKSFTWVTLENLAVVNDALQPEVKGQEKEIIKLNALLKEYARSAKIPYVDYHSAMKDENDGLPKKYADDGCHPNRNGYELMEKIILEYL